ncbi:MAG TPA: PEP-CTERM sorting domain-containing protein [Phycisphaerae bacterium]|nr:PEP-CTERM sorting domain-containing protein [Phycisphaerae bacterium]
MSRKFSRKIMISALSAAAASVICGVGAVKADTISYSQDYQYNAGDPGTYSATQGPDQGITLFVIDEGNPGDAYGNVLTGYTAYLLGAETTANTFSNVNGDVGGAGEVDTPLADSSDNSWNIAAMEFGGSGGSTAFGITSTAGFLQEWIQSSVHRSTGVTTTTTSPTPIDTIINGSVENSGIGADSSYQNGSADSHFLGSSGTGINATGAQSPTEGNAPVATPNNGTNTNAINAIVIAGFNNGLTTATGGSGANKTTTTLSLITGTDTTLLDTYSIVKSDQSTFLELAYLVVPNGSVVSVNGEASTINPTATYATNIPFIFTFGAPVASGPNAPQFVFTLDNTTAVTEPDGASDTAGGSEVAGDDKNVSGDKAQLNSSGPPNYYETTAYMDLAGSAGGDESTAYYNYTGASNSHQLIELLKFTSSAGGDPVATNANLQADLVSYILANEDGTISSVIDLVGTSGHIFTAADADLGVANDGGWDLELIDNSVTGDPMAGMDFSQFNIDGITPGQLEVAQIAVVPEPASLGLMAIGAAGLLLRGRKKKA